MNQFLLTDQLETLTKTLLVSYHQFVNHESFAQLPTLTHLMWVWFLYLWDTIIGFINTLNYFYFLYFIFIYILKS